MLRKLEKASGQQINIDKSSVFFNRNTEIETKNELCDKLRFYEAEVNSKYLGLSDIIERKKTAVVGYFRETFQDRVHGWDKKLLLKGGK